MTRKALLATCVTGWAPSRILGRVQAGDYRYFDTRFAALAHRGGYLSPADQPRENTLHAFRSAVEYGYRYLETDAHASSDGVLFSSNPRGDNREGWNGPRYGAYHDLQAWQALLTAAGFVELEHYYRPAGLPRAQQPWLASVWRKR